jgi:lipid A oxidase
MKYPLRIAAYLVVPILLGAICPAPSRADAEFEMSVYGGYQGAANSDVTISGSDSFDAQWDGKSFSAPPYYGFRATVWTGSQTTKNLGISLDFSHAKVYASQATLDSQVLNRLEFTDGLNLLTLNALYRFKKPTSKWIPYVGLGAGISIPHVEVSRQSGTTFGYQVGGPTLQMQAGIAYAINPKWSVFGEYKGNYSFVDVGIDSGDSLKTNLFTSALNLGVSYKF